MKRNNHNLGCSGLFFLLLLLPGCFLVSFRDIGYTTYPAEVNEIIPIGEALYIEFDFPVDRTGAEKNIKIMKASQILTGDSSWVENRLVWQPVPELIPGKRYAFTYKGQVESDFGEIFSLHLEIPFYAGTADPPPQVSSFTPPLAADVSVTDPLTLIFSKAINQASFDEGFTLSPVTEYNTLWNAAGTTVTLAPETGWKPLTYYKWQATDVITDTGGIPLAYPVDGGFLTQADNTAPQIASVLPGLQTPSGFLLLPGDLNALTREDVILLNFTEDIDFQSLITSFSLVPSLNGSLQRIEAASFAFIPADGFAMDTGYTLKIDTECRDLAGIALSSAYELSFTPDIPVLLVPEVRNIPALLDFTPAEYNTPAAYLINLALPANTHTFTIVFSQAIDAAYREQVSGAVSCKTFFPPGIPTLLFALENASWNISGTELSLTWTGFANSPSAANPYYYELTIPAGQNGAANSSGSSLEEEIRILLEAPV